MVTSSLIVAFALYDRVTQFDFTGPYEVFWRPSDAQCVAAFATGGEIHADDGLAISNAQRLADVPHADLTCVPGGSGMIEAMEDAGFVRQVRRLAGGARYVTFVYSGSSVLGAAGLLQGKRAACHWARRNLLPAFGTTVDEARVVRDGNLITGSGVTAGIDIALAVIADIAGAEHVQTVQLGIEYAPAPPFDCGRPERAAPEILAAVTPRLDHLRADRHDAMQRAAQRLRAPVPGGAGLRRQWRLSTYPRSRLAPHSA